MKATQRMNPLAHIACHAFLAVWGSGLWAPCGCPPLVARRITRSIAVGVTLGSFIWGAGQAGAQETPPAEKSAPPPPPTHWMYSLGTRLEIGDMRQLALGDRRGGGQRQAVLRLRRLHLAALAVAGAERILRREINAQMPQPIF